MDAAYEKMKNNLKALAEQQERAAAESPDTDEIVGLPLSGRSVSVALYRADPQAPVVFACYGGGFVMGTYVLDAPLWREMGRRMGVTVVSIAYRLAPEHPFPSALHDVYDVIAYAGEHADELGICMNDVSVCGNSAGGNLAAAVCLFDAQRGGKLGIRRQFLNYPFLDLVTSPASKGHAISERAVYEVFRGEYCAASQAADPLVSPIYADEELLSLVPPAFIAVAERDPLMAEDSRYACRLRAAGVPVKFMMAFDMAHGYLEAAFQPETPYMDDTSREQLRDGTMRACALETIDFMAAGLGLSR
ncbi:MAG: alpha/beta hydrolase [Atopobiaceae bacterium]|nr:alpha/beta hydrolase [Atopobiaceae bacterium]MBR1828480.1 alpha/beta hydrolase [Atopobiaceae bacterium]